MDKLELNDPEVLYVMTISLIFMVGVEKNLKKS